MQVCAYDVLIRYLFGIMLEAGPVRKHRAPTSQKDTEMKDQGPEDPRSASIRHVREVAAARVANTSLRGVAREIGMSPMGLRNFIHGTAPYSPTLRRLRNWYVRYAAQRSGNVQIEDATAALSVLVHDMDSAPRRQTALVVLDAVGRGYEMSGVEKPEWVSELRTRYEA
jgi:hypothetical protein